MPSRRELSAFATVLAVAVVGFLHGPLLGGKVLSSADVLFVSASFREHGSGAYEPANRLLTDPVFQFQPWTEFNRAMFRRGRLPLWNDLVGCGAPHLANGQCAAFDPFHLLAYLGPLPRAQGWVAAGRLWVAGLGMFLLAGAWGFDRAGRWFAGLAFSFCGFLVAWLLYPVTASAVWMPWLFLSTERMLATPGRRRAGALALAVGLVLFGGHVQTGAHVLLAAGLYALWRGPTWRARGGWAAGVALGVALAAVQVVPLGMYLRKSPVWADRRVEQPSALAVGKPRVLDAACTALPYLFGSQRRGHPNLARALGVHNLNESAGGFAGLATLVWLAPLAVGACWREPRVKFLAALGGFGAMAAFEIPPAPNFLRALPVLDVTDHRRMTLWVAFALVLLGGRGLDRLGPAMRAGWGRRWTLAWPALALAALAAAGAVRVAEPTLRARAEAHYARAAGATPGADPAAYRARAERQIGQALDFVPRYLAISAGHLGLLWGLALAARRGRLGARPARLAAGSIALVDLYAFGLGLNPAIDPADHRPEPAVIAYLRREVGVEGRALGLGEELPPNVLMRYGLADARNYDSVELERSWSWFEPLYESDRPSARTSRREITWDGVIRARDRLAAAGVRAVVAATPPPPEAFSQVDRVGAVWVARPAADPLVSAGPGASVLGWSSDAGRVRVDLETASNSRVEIRQTFDPGWRAEVDGRPAEVRPWRGTFLAVDVPAGARTLRLRYDPPEVRAAACASLAALVAVVFALTGFRPLRSTRIVGPRLGRTQPARLESRPFLRPAAPTGSSKITEARGADGPLHV